MATIGVTDAQAQDCRQAYGDAHDTQLAVNGECAWCGAYVSQDTPLGHVDTETGNVYDAAGNILEQHTF